MFKTTDESEERNPEDGVPPPKPHRWLITIIVVLLIIAAFALSWLTMPRSRRSPSPAHHNSSQPQSR